MKKLLLLCVACCSVTVYAQDVIVKKDGSTILSKVIKIGTTEVEYKKFSNQNGPTYSIQKSDIHAINYENGEKDLFDTTTPSPSNTPTPLATSTPFGVNPNLAEDNLRLVREFNSHDPIYIGDNAGKKKLLYAKVLGIKEGSILETPEIKASFSMKIWHGKVTTFGHSVVEEKTINIGEASPFTFSNYQYKIIILLKNKTNKTIYIDLANSYILRNNQAYPYYVPTVTSTIQGGTSGGSVNLGAVAGAVGVKGAIGKLINGVNVGGSNTNVKTQTTYSQRIVSIPPMSSLAMDPMEIGQGMTWETSYRFKYQETIMDAYSTYLKTYHNSKYTRTGYLAKGKIIFTPKDFKRGSTINIPPLDDVNPLGAFVTYSFDESMNATQSMRIDFYLRQILGVDYSNPWNKIDFSKCPLIFI